MTKHILEIQHVKKQFEGTEVLKGIDLSVEEGEFITLLGASGCGKTTTLRIVAGLEQPDEGKVFLEGGEVTHFPPNKRNVNTVFQNYALFPHMTVAQNIAYGQKIKKISRTEIEKRVKDALSLVQLDDFGDRRPDQLSGGQRQRVAIARAVINRPKVLLLDEPLGALDLKLRQQMQIELKRLQKKLGITFLYITHDQEEALNMSNRIVVMKEGLFEQIGTPMAIYNDPISSYVATFVGAANIVKAGITKQKGEMFTVENQGVRGQVLARDGRHPKGEQAVVAIRGECIKLKQKPEEGRLSFPAIVKEKNFVGGSMHILLALDDGQQIVSYCHGIHCAVEVDDRVFASWNPEDALFVDLED